MIKKEKMVKCGLMAIAFVYVIALFKIILFKYGIFFGIRSVQPIPFLFVSDFFNQTTSMDVYIKNVLGNFALFIPFGILVPALIKRAAFKWTILAGFLTSLFFELIQLITGMGVFDVDDLILNTLGALAGAFLYFGVLKRFKKEFVTGLASFVFLSVFGICSILVLWNYFPNYVPMQIVFINEEAFGGFDKHSCTLNAKLDSIEDKAVVVSNVYYTNGEKCDLAQYAFSKDIKIILEKREYNYSVNGNIQKQTISYSLLEKAEAVEAMTSEKHHFRDELWLNEENECYMLLITNVEN